LIYNKLRGGGKNYSIRKSLQFGISWQEQIHKTWGGLGCHTKVLGENTY